MSSGWKSQGPARRYRLRGAALKARRARLKRQQAGLQSSEHQKGPPTTGAPVAELAGPAIGASQTVSEPQQYEARAAHRQGRSHLRGAALEARRRRLTRQQIELTITAFGPLDDAV